MIRSWLKVGGGLFALVGLFTWGYLPLSSIWHTYQNKFAVEYYIANLSNFNTRKLYNTPQGAVLFYGDSLMQGLAVQAAIENAVNLGVGHANTSFVLQQMESHQFHLASSFVVAVGINDVLNGYPEAVVEGYLGIIDTVPDNIPLIINLLAPVGDAALAHRNIVVTIEQVNSQLKILCEQKPFVYCLSMKEKLAGKKGLLQAEHHVGDGLHLSAKANALWIQELSALLSEVESESSK